MKACVHVSCLSQRGGKRFKNLRTGAMIPRGNQCCCLILSCRLRVLQSSTSAPPERKSNSPPPPWPRYTMSAGVREINLGGCRALLTYQPKSILLTGIEMIALSLTGRVRKAKKKKVYILLNIVILVGWCYPTNIFF